MRVLCLVHFNIIWFSEGSCFVSYSFGPSIVYFVPFPRSAPPQSPCRRPGRPCDPVGRPPGRGGSLGRELWGTVQSGRGLMDRSMRGRMVEGDPKGSRTRSPWGVAELGGDRF